MEDNLINGNNFNFNQQNLFISILFSRMNLSLISFLCLLFVCTSRSNGIQPTQRIQNIPYLMTQLVNFEPNSFNPTITKFESSHQPHHLQIGLQRQIKNIIDQNIITTGFNSNSNGNLGYSVKSNLTDNDSKVSIQLQVLGHSLFTKFKFTVIIMSAPLQMGNAYLAMFELEVSSPSQTKLISMPDLEKYNFYPFVKSTMIESVHLSVSPLSSMGFGTKGEKKSTENSGGFYELGFYRQNIMLEQNISVTYVVIAINQALLRQTAQFSSLSFSVTWQWIKTDSLYLIPEGYDTKYNSNSIYGYSEWPGVNRGPSFLDFTLLQSKGVKFSNNFVTNRFKYLALQLIDYDCPESHPFKFKNDSLCYACQEGQIAHLDQANIFNEYQSSIRNDKGQKIRISISGYKFGKDGSIVSVCAYWNEKKNLEVEHFEEKSNPHQDNPITSLKKKIISNLSKLYKYITQKTKINVQISGLTTTEKSSSQPIELIREKPVQRIK